MINHFETVKHCVCCSCLHCFLHSYSVVFAIIRLFCVCHCVFVDVSVVAVKRCTNKTLVDYRLANSRCLTIGRLSANCQLIQKTYFAYLHCVSKKVPTFELCVTLSNLNQFSKFLHCWKAYEICYKTHTTLPTSP